MRFSRVRFQTLSERSSGGRSHSLWLLMAGFGLGPVFATEIPEPEDAPKPRSPEETARSYRLPEGFRLEVVVSEPLIASPSGLCWDESGRMFVSELHGYNLEGQLDIEELNKSGKLDTEVRRIQADEKFKLAAREGTYGVVKLLEDSDGDGRMDRAKVWADDLPPAYGLVPARGGVIVACAPHIVYLADADSNGHAEVREILFTGFETGALERGINSPQWGWDGWIYLSRGHGGGTITGPRLSAPFELPGSDFRIRADGSAIEPVTGGTHTFGFALTPSGDRFVSATTSPGVFVAPLPWQYLARNPNAAVSGLEASAGDGRVYPAAPPHPWRLKRAGNPAYFRFYRDRYGASDSDAGGWFTSACGPFVYLDPLLPGLRGQYLVCEPSGNILHRAEMVAEGTMLKLHRVPGEEESEFGASEDGWSHPIFLTHAPDGRIGIVDYYREIIEDYSAIPRYLQQQYGLYAGHDRGRIYLLTHRGAASPSVSWDMSGLTGSELARETGSPLYWRRRTAQRLLGERGDAATASLLRELLGRDEAEPLSVIARLRTLEELGALAPEDLPAWLAFRDPAVRVHAWQLTDRWLGRAEGSKLLDAALAAADVEDDPRVLIQCALSLGATRDARAFTRLEQLAREKLDLRWMDAALLSSLAGREWEMLSALLPEPGGALPLVELLARSIAAGGDVRQLSAVLTLAGTVPSDLQALLLEALVAGRKDASPLPFADALRSVLAAWESSETETVRIAARELGESFERTQPVDASEAGYTPLAANVSDEEVAEYLAALDRPRDREHGHEVFRETCALCHRVGEEGHVFGPDVLGELGIAEETLVRHLLFPAERIRPGFETVSIQTKGGQQLAGVLADEGATSVTLRLPGGVEQVILRKDVDSLRRLPGSLMPSLAGVISPGDMANVLSWLRDQLRAP